MAEIICFKVYVDYGDGVKPEVRRFGFEKIKAINFEHVCNKVREMFPLLRKCKFNIGWKDDEDDFVSISSDEELQIALSMLSDDTKKLHVVVGSSESDMDPPEIEIVAGFLEEPNISSDCDNGPKHHLGVVCDGCDNPVVGFRYKCMSCVDYDLCVQCEWAGMHSQHVMLRIPKPINKTVLHHHHGSRLVHHLLKSLRKENNTESMPKNLEQKLLKNLSNELGSTKKLKERKDRKEHCKRSKGMKADCMDKVASCLEVAAKHMAERNGVARAQCTDATVGTDQAFGDSRKNEPKSQEGDVNFIELNQQFLNSIENMASKILEPLCTVGMEVFKQLGSQPMHIFPAGSEAGGPSTDTAGDRLAKESTEASLKDAAEGQQTSYADNDAVETSSLASEKQVSDKASSTTSERIEEWTLINDPSDKDLQQLHISNETNQSDVGENASGVTVKPVIASAPPPVSNDKNSFGVPVGPYHNLMKQVMADLNTKKPEEFHQLRQKAQANDANDVGIPQCIPLGFKSVVTNQPLPPPATFYSQRPTNVMPNAPIAGHNMPAVTVSQTRSPPARPPTASPAPLHPKPHIDSALQHMLAMGFCNEGGWLTQLLESKDGNISAVLDLLSPAKQSN